MINYTMEIKNLSIALECLSRIQALSSEYYDVKDLLAATIKKQEELNQEPTTPASVARHDPTHVNPDDEVS